MSAVSLYRSYRPRTFSEVVGQHHVITALQQSIRTNRIGHAYLFCGTRGTGKTTLAKIFARAINCSNPHETEPCNECAICQGSLDGSLLDIIEMDAASNNSVDTIRRITDEVVFTPTMARYRVYIIDEVHMLSNGAFNALLKTLEEPPAHAVFILATTDPQRIPATILSRCQRYDLHAMTREQIQTHLRKIADENNIPANDDALSTLAILAKGAMRDAISLLDQCKVSFSSAFGRQEVLQLLGQADDERMGAWVEDILTSNIRSALETLHHLINRGLDVQRLTLGLLQYLRDILLCQFIKEPQELLPYSGERIAKQRALAELKSVFAIQEMIRLLSSLIPQYRYTDQPRLLLEIALIQLAELHSDAGAKAEILQEKHSVTQTALMEDKVEENLLRSTSLTSSQVTSEPIEAEPTKPAKLAPDLWPKAYQKLQTNGGIVLYMLLKNQRIENTGEELLFYFEANQEAAYHEFCKATHQKKLAETLASENMNQAVKLEIKWNKADDGIVSQQQENPVDQLRQFAKKHQINFEMEDE